MHKISCSVLVLGGKQDKVVTGEASKEIAGKLQCEIYMYDELEHVIVYSDNFNEYSDRHMLEVFEEFFNYVRKNEKVFHTLMIRHDNNRFNCKMLDIIMEKYKMSLECNGEVPRHSLDLVARM